jgi:hypothetical protein
MNDFTATGDSPSILRTRQRWDGREWQVFAVC